MIRTRRLALHPHASGWQIRDATTGLPVGSITYVGRVDDALVIGYEVANGHRNLGYASEALRAVLNGTTARVVAETQLDHVASRRVMEKAGMRLRDLDGGTVRYVYDLPSSP